MTMLNRLRRGPSRTALNAGSPAGGAEWSVEALIELMDRIRTEATRLDGAEVDYEQAERHLRTARQRLYRGLRGFDPAALTARDQRFAFWINLYNILMLDAVLVHRVTRSVVGPSQGFLRFFEKSAYVVGGMRFSANDMEHGILRSNAGHPLSPRPQFPADDPRQSLVIKPLEPKIHFALNCASRSCPPIRVYTGQHLASQLSLATRSFLSAETRVMPAENRLETSAIFKWYRQDFEAAGGVVDFTIRHLDEADPRAAWLRGHAAQVTVRYRKYDWRLNRISA